MSRTRKSPYTGSKRFDKTCRNHGSCPYCRDNRTFERAPEKSEELRISEPDDDGQFVDWVNERINQTMQFGDDYAFAREIAGCTEHHMEIFCDGVKVARCAPGDIQ